MVGHSKMPKALLAWAMLTLPAPVPADAPSSERLADLAAQLDVGEYAPAAAGAQRLIATIEAQSGRYDPALAGVLRVLGDAQMGLDDPQAAFAAYDRAKHILRIDDGVQGLGQLELLYREADALAAMGDRSAANDRHEFAYSLEARLYGEDALELVPAAYRLIDWYMHNYKFRPAQVLYQQIIDVVKEAYPPNDPRIIKAIRGYADTYRQRRFGGREPGRGGFYAWPPGHPKDPPWYSKSSFRRGRKALEEVLELTRETPNASDTDVANALVEYADWNLLHYEYGVAMRNYRRAWALLESNPEHRAKMFEKPNALYLRLPGDPARQSQPLGRARHGVVQLALTVSHRGDVLGRRTLRSEPHNIMEFKLRRAAKHARYRPAFESGDPVPRRDLKLEFKYRYYPGDDSLAR